MIRFTGLAALLLLLLPGPGSHAQTEEEQARSQLQKLKHEMARLGDELEQDLRDRGSMQLALRQSEKAIGKIRRDINQTRQKLAWARDKLADLRSQRQQLQVARGEQQELITREIQTAYQMGKQGQLKILLNQEQPDTLARAMAYYTYFHAARQEHIARYISILQRIDVLEPEIAGTAEQLQRSRTTLAQQQRQLLAGQRRRESELRQLESQIAGKDQQLQRMDRDREELQELLEVIGQAIAAMEAPPEPEHFAELQGRMPWPAAGQPSNRFGRKRGGGKQTWQGLNIPAPEGSDVTAIHQGRVVFADWFRGSGLLLIIDHGDGYMSLYAHNQALLRNVGEWVDRGAAIATVGNSGGRRETALYFEIRENGKPVNPTRWLSRG